MAPTMMEVMDLLDENNVQYIESPNSHSSDLKLDIISFIVKHANADDA